MSTDRQIKIPLLIENSFGTKAKSIPELQHKIGRFIDQTNKIFHLPNIKNQQSKDL